VILFSCWMTIWLSISLGWLAASVSLKPRTLLSCHSQTQFSHFNFACIDCRYLANI
jgi:hypothetical protein